MVGNELHLWQVRLEGGEWPSSEALPAAERDRAADMATEPARRWVAARWALRGVLARYLAREPAWIELRFGNRGKPALADPEAALRFNLSHSGGLALIAIGAQREVGVDVERLGSKPADFYAAWTQREAVAKCLGTGLWAPLPDDPVAVSAIDTEPGFAAAVAVAGGSVPFLRRFSVEPGRGAA